MGGLKRLCTFLRVRFLATTATVPMQLRGFLSAIYPAVRAITGIRLSACLKIGGILIPYLASNQYMRMGTASRKIHQKLTNSSCRLLTGNISPPTGGRAGSPLIVGLRSNLRNLCP